MQKIITYIKAHKIISGIAAIVILFGGYKWYASAHATAGKISYVTQAAQKTTITVSVTGSGQVSEQNKIDLKPGGSGSITAVDVKQGDTVKAGQTIAIVDEKNNLTALTQARAGVSSAQANYDKVLAGATTTDTEIAQASLDSAKNSLTNAQTSYTNTVTTQQQAVANAQTSMLNAGLAAVPSGANFSTATISVSGTYTDTVQGSYNLNVTNTGGIAMNYNGLEAGMVYIFRGVPVAIGTKGLYITVSTSGTLNPGDAWVINLPNKQSSAYQGAADAYQSALQNQTQAVANAQSSVTNAQLNLQTAQANYDAKVAPPTQADVEAASAQLQTAQAQLQTAETAYDANILRAPFDGVVAQLNNQKGDQVTSSTVVATIITKEALAVMSLNEVDVAKIKIGDKANLTFDAIDGLNITGEVVEIDTIGTVSQGVVTYGVKIAFDTQDQRVKPGMSVSAAIITDAKTDVIAVPNSAVKTNATGTYVQELDASGNPTSVTVQTGIASDTLTEIISGVNEGDKVVTQTINTTAKTTTTSSSAVRIPGITGGNATFGGGGAGFTRGAATTTGR